MAGVFMRRPAPSVTFASHSRLMPIDFVSGSARLCSMWSSGVVMSPPAVVLSCEDQGRPPERFWARPPSLFAIFFSSRADF